MTVATIRSDTAAFSAGVFTGSSGTHERTGGWYRTLILETRTRRWCFVGDIVRPRSFGESGLLSSREARRGSPCRPRPCWYSPFPMPPLLICIGDNHDTLYKYVTPPWHTPQDPCAASNRVTCFKENIRAGFLCR